ncbi:MAG: transglutaminase-like domain-containing protein [Planctomycetota bacterium]|jgi:hypothetical protein
MILGGRAFFSWACTGLALSHLPQELVPPPWLLAFTIPAAGLYLLQRFFRAPGWAQIGIASGLQILAVLLVSRLSNPPDALAALGCTLIPPLIYLQCRLQPSDCIRALFLAFCLLLVGSILDEASGLVSILFLCSAAIALYLNSAVDDLTERYSWRTPASSRSARMRRALSLAACALVFCGLIFQGLQLLPSPGRPETPKTSAANAPKPARGQVGLSSTFEFGSSTGPLDLRNDRILIAEPADERPLPANLYLRSSYFDQAGLDGWQRLAPRRELESIRGEFARPLAGLGRRRIELTLISDPLGKVFMPPGSYAMSGLSQVLGNPSRGLFITRSSLPPGSRYRVSYQELPIPIASRKLSRAQATDLIHLPREILAHESIFRNLLDSARAKLRSRHTPAELAMALADELRQRCQYSLEEPRGEYAHSILNFLEGDQQGFCMHFASATAICLRLAGVPCRIGVGLHAGEPEGETGMVFGSQDAHAWVEIPYSELGWVVFDPSPPANPGEELGWPMPGDEASGDQSAEGEGEDSLLSGRAALELFTKPLSFPWIWLSILLLAFLPRRIKRAKKQNHSFARIPAKAQPCKQLLVQLLKLLAKKGHRRSYYQTLEDYFERINGQEKLPLQSIREAFTTYQEVRFGGKEFGEDRRRVMETAIAAIKG